MPLRVREGVHLSDSLTLRTIVISRRFGTQKHPCRYVMSNGVRHLALDFSLR